MSVPFDIALAGLRAAAPSVPENAVAALRRLAGEGFALLDSVEVAAVAFGQLAHESREFNAIEENLNYSAAALRRVWPSRFRRGGVAEALAHKPEAIANYVYADRMGNTALCDGWRYRGRGYLQLTGRGNYTAAGEALGLPLVDRPQMAAQPRTAWLIAAWYFESRQRRGKILLHWAERLHHDNVTRAINGGTHGFEDRVRRTELALEAMRERVSPALLVHGRDNKDWRAVQRRLAVLGYAPGPVDGIRGPLSETALRRFQEAAGLVETGFADLRTLEALNAATPNLAA